jgi:hypothetical protein
MIHRLRTRLSDVLIRLALYLREPAPTDTDGPAVWDLVIADMRTILPDDAATFRLILDGWGRDNVGRSKYGKRLGVHNGRDPLLDGYSERLDACAYDRQAIERATGTERAVLWTAYHKQLRSAYERARMMNGRGAK